MKRNLIEAILLGALVSLLFFRLSPGVMTAKAAGTVQYTVIGEIQDSELESVLNRYAAQGWELRALTFPEDRKHMLILEKSSR